VAGRDSHTGATRAGWLAGGHPPNRSASDLTGLPFRDTMTSPSTRRPYPSRMMPCRPDSAQGSVCRQQPPAGATEPGPALCRTGGSNFDRRCGSSLQQQQRLQRQPTFSPALSAGVPGGTSSTSTPSSPICLSACTARQGGGCRMREMCEIVAQLAASRKLPCTCCPRQAAVWVSIQTHTGKC
jgi:hypothetical protein